MTTGFTIAVAAAVLAAIGFAVAPLLRRHENENSSITPLLVLVLALLIPSATWLIYQSVGTPEGIAPDTSDAAQVRASLIDLARAVESNPEESENWVRMGLAYKELQEFSSAEHAFRRALYIDQQSPFVRVELAETLLFASGERKLPDQAHKLLNEALETTPGNQKALWLLGLDALQRGEYDEAVARLERLERILPEGNVRDTVQNYLSQARNQGDTAAAVPEPGTDNGPTLTVSLSLEDALSDRISGDETVFVIVRAAEGSRVPLAVQRLSAGELPAQVEFDGGASMMGGTSMADVPAIRVTARISHGGQAQPQEGDFEGSSDALTVSGQVDTHVHIDRIL